MIKDIPAEGDVYYSDEAEMSLTITFEKYRIIDLLPKYRTFGEKRK